MNRQQKAERYDAMANHANQLELAIYDLINGKFEPWVTVKPSEYDTNWDGGVYKVAMSWRGMPLFIIRYCERGQQDHTVVMDEQEIRDRYRNHPNVLLHKVLNRAMQECLVRHDQAEQAKRIAAA